MAEGLVFNMIEKLIGKLGSLAVESWNVRDDLETLVHNLSEIKAVILDAEEQQSTNHQIELWLDNLNDVLDDADDLLDDFSTEDLRRQVMTRGKKAKKLRIFLSSSNQLVFSFKMAQKIKEIKKRVEALNVGRKTFHFANRTPEQRGVLKQRQTHSFVREEDVIGIEEEKKELLQMLLNTDMDMKEENVSIISIIGIGGLGKTALAQLLYNDKAVQEHFEFKKWVCVSDDFDVKAIAMKIMESQTTCEMDQVQQELRMKIEGKRYLLVLDDIWNEDREHWLQLMTLLKGGAKGSKIVITTRSEQVAKITGTSLRFPLKGLDEYQSWKLFTKLAFENGQEPENQMLVSIGKEIVKKCAGVPLAIRSIGSLMYSKETESDWLNFKDKDLVKIDEQGGNMVFQIIKLSYDHLPFHLKKCFSFCSLFPKDHDIRREELIQLWVAQGFVQSSDENRCLEDVGNEYFMNLAHRSFFQDLVRDFVLNEVLRCKMHDIVHDLAKFVSEKYCVIVIEEGQHIGKQIRHLSFGFPLNSSWKPPSSLLKAYKLRTFLLSKQQYREQLTESACNLILSSFEQLRVLDLKILNLRMIPSCIGMLKHLRYLDLSCNKQIEVLPRCITKLNNLQTLLLSHCSMLRELPRDIWKLTSLRHLDLDGCDKLTYMPRGMGQLTNLQTLTMFVLDTTSKHSGRASGLKELNNLRGSLSIKGLECLRQNPIEAKDINLMGKQHLQVLELIWKSQINVDNNDMMDKDDVILQGLGLLLLHNIKSLNIGGFGGVTFATSLVSSSFFTNLVFFELSDCPRLQCLPQLHLSLHLKILSLSSLPCIEWVENNINSYGNNSSSTSFPSLRCIMLLDLPNLKGWCRCGNGGMCCHQFEIISFLWVHNCPNLTSVPHVKDLESVVLEKVQEKILQQVVSHSKIRSLHITGIDDLKSIRGVLQHLTTVRMLWIRSCGELDPCNDKDGCYSMHWKELQNLEWLEFISIPKMEYLPEGLQHLTSLTSLTIEDCANFRHIPEWTKSLQKFTIKGCPDLVSA